MTSLEIEILLHYFCRIGDYSISQELSRTIDRLLELELLYEDILGDRNYMLSDRGEAYVQALLSLPLPVKKWEIPQEEI